MKNFAVDQRLGILAWNTWLSKYIEQSVRTDLRCYISISDIPRRLSDLAETFLMF